MIKSKALEVNLASYRVDVSIDEKYMILQNIMMLKKNQWSLVRTMTMQNPSLSMQQSQSLLTNYPLVTFAASCPTTQGVALELRKALFKPRCMLFTVSLLIAHTSTSP